MKYWMDKENEGDRLRKKLRAKEQELANTRAQAESATGPTKFERLNRCKEIENDIANIKELLKRWEE